MAQDVIFTDRVAHFVLEILAGFSVTFRELIERYFSWVEGKKIKMDLGTCLLLGCVCVCVWPVADLAETVSRERERMQKYLGRVWRGGAFLRVPRCG